MNLAALVDKVGRMNQYLQQHGREWGNQEWIARRKKLLALMEEMDRELIRQHRRITDFGWTLTVDAQWKRIGDPDPPPRMNMAEIAKQFPAFARAAAREQRESEQPDLFDTSGDLTGTCPL